MRILHVIASLSPVRGGTTSSVLQMLSGLQAQGIACEVATSDDDGPGRRLPADAPERALPNRHYFAKRNEFYGYCPDMAHWLAVNAGNYDLVHVHGLFSHVNGLAGRICRRRRVPYIVTPHGMANRYGMRHKPLLKKVSFALVERALLEGSAAVHLTSRYEERDFTDLGLRAECVRVPLSVAAMPPGNGAAFRNRHPDIGNLKVAVFMGRLNPIKNLEAAIDALSLPGGNDVHLVVCGDGPDDYAALLKARAAELGVADRISWLGFVSGQLKADALAAGDVYVQPSRSESFGMAAVEAVSAGLPCVLGKDVAIGEDLVEAGFAISVEPTGEHVALGLSTALGLPGTATDRALRARGFVERVFGQKAIGSALSHLYLRSKPADRVGGASADGVA